MNIKLLRRIQRHISKDARRIDMNTWATRVQGPACGTTACIAGWATILHDLPANPTPQEVRDAARGIVFSAKDSGTRALKLAHNAASRLFFVFYWPDRYRHQYYDARTHKAEASVVVRRINHFIKTNGWE